MAAVQQQEQLIATLLSLPSSQLPRVISHPTTQSALAHLLTLQHLSPSTSSSIRQPLFSLFFRLSSLSSPIHLNIGLVPLFCAAFAQNNLTKVESVLNGLLAKNPTLAKEVNASSSKALLEGDVGLGEEGWELKAKVHLRLMKALPSAYKETSKEVLDILGKWYTFPDTSSSRSFLLFKLEILETSFHLLRALSFPSPSTLPSTSQLYIDLERYFFVSVRIVEKDGDVKLSRWFSDLVGVKGVNGVGKDWVAELREVLEREERKGKGKEKVSPPPPSSSLDQNTIQQILDVLPTFPLAHLRLLISSPLYTSDANQTAAEKIIGAVLEGRLDMDTPAIVAPPPQVRLQEKEKIVRRNVFEDEKIKKDQILSKAKNRPVEMKFEMSEALKAAIIERAEAPSSDEEEDEQEAFLDETEDGGHRAVKFHKDGSGSEDEEDDRIDSGPSAPPSRDPLANPIGPILSHLLEETYLAEPAVFTRDSATRKSKNRVALREKTGLADEQIEGWKIMFERDPKKDKILAKHEFKGNKVATGSGGGGEAGEHGSERKERQKQESSNRGGGDRGRGGGRGGNRGRGDGGRMAHNRRQRGNYKKMAKVG